MRRKIVYDSQPESFIPWHEFNESFGFALAYTMDAMKLNILALGRDVLFIIFTIKISINFLFVGDDRSPCYPSPCGPYSICLVQSNRAICSCSRGYHGSPPNCRPECLVSSECLSSLACINQKCSDPCQNVCGLNALCEVRNHNPLCSCPKGFVGDPFTQCLKEGKIIHYFK